ncbi:hypothetical protein DICPUDRAFT_57270 [Dictyostelium purpureum]|uniref:Uncharacterized protein n=1 Tax=Dictyostelium purpureum TaxID=5786 RepID=F0ZVA7_DICPU|nr:uncharacterized protein DICPUDRAFT_57270 [Dictyostelium purpureum]EGC32135.1 hypothetical protein DICPUDRAFT_57270 [Dictyostelium purpureum]|eukprot:XP_003291344.1 hypothetical protein DICPUDRAFT_57270 [Dictyostelium purpureum]
MGVGENNNNNSNNNANGSNNTTLNINSTTSNNLTSYDEVEKGFRVHEEDEAVELNESLNEFNNESRVGVSRDDSDVGEAQEEDDDNNKNMEFKFDLDLTTINVMDDIDDFEKKLLEYSEKEQVVQDFNKNNIDLIQYSKQVGESLEKCDKEMNALYQDILPDYVNERENFHLMYKAITESKSLLVGFETMLNGFQNELTSISKEMRTLQELSINENLKCTNRKKVVEKLHKIIDEVSISDDLITLLTQGEVNDQYLQYLSIFSKKIGYIQTQKSEGVFATGEVEEVILKLLQVVLDKIFKFFNNQFNQIKDISTLQTKQQEMTLYRQAFIFLYKHTRRVAKQLFDQYKEIAAGIYSNYYRSYITFLEKLQIEPTTRNDLIGMHESKTKGFFNSKSNKLKIKTSIYTVETRYQILNELEYPPLKPQSIGSESSASSTQIKYSYEVIFRSLLFFIIDLVSYENMFLKDYFLSNKDSSTLLFSKPESLFVENINCYLSSTYDIVALLLILCITSKYKSRTTRSDLTDRLFQFVINSTISRLTILFEENISSIRSANVKELLPIEENRPHYIVRRYSELVGSFANNNDNNTTNGTNINNNNNNNSSSNNNINKFNFNNNKTQESTSLLLNIKESHSIINENLAIMRVEMFKLINKLSEELKGSIQKHIFLLNNYDLILTILSDKLGPNDTNEDKEYWTILYDKEAEQYCTEQLGSFQYIKNIINTVKELYPLIELYTIEEINHPKLKKEILEEILKQFSQNWRVGIEEMNIIVTQQFPNFKNGMKIFQMMLDKLFTNYKQFTQIILKFFKNLKTSPFYLAETEISYEIKKYYGSFD